MTLGRLLACVIAFVAIWSLALNLAELRFDRAGVAPPLWFYSLLVIRLLVPCVVVLLRERIAGWVLGGGAGLRAPFDHRAILVVGSAGTGIHMFLNGLSLVLMVWVVADWSPIGWKSALRYPAVYLFTSLLLVVGARFLPFVAGWGLLESSTGSSGRLDGGRTPPLEGRSEE